MLILRNWLARAALGGTIGLPQASTMAVRVDALHDFLFYLSLAMLLPTTAVMIWFVIRYHRSAKGRMTSDNHGNHALEWTWSVATFILMMVVFAWGYKDYRWLRSEPINPVEVNVIGRQWLWNYEYPNGRKSTGELFLPVNKPIKLIMTSEDVIHSFFIPNFRIKQDVVPGMFTYLSFTPTLVGSHPVYCAEFCGTGHSDMLGKVTVLSQADYDAWFETGRLAQAGRSGGGGGGLVATAQAAETRSGADKGKELFNSKGCVACHSVDGTRKVGPSLKGIWGKNEELEGGATVLVDENYVRESLMEPAAKIVKGYAPTMPTFKGTLSDEEVNSLIAYIKSLK